MSISPQPTPAMQAGLVGRELRFRDVFAAVAAISLFAALLIRVRWRRQALVLGSAPA